MRSPYSSYPSAHGDVFSSMMQGSDASRGMGIAQKRSERGAQSRDFAQRYALQGLQNEIDQQNQQNNLTQSRMDGAFGPLGSLLRGLYQ